MAHSAPLGQWLELLHGDGDEVAITEAWRAVRPADVLNECVRSLLSARTGIAELYTGLEGSEAEQFLEYLYRYSSGYARDSPGGAVETGRLMGALRGMVAGALAVQAATEGRADLAERRLAECVGAWGGPPPREGAVPPQPVGEAAELLEALRLALWPSGRGTAPARAWINELLTARRRERERQAGMAPDGRETPPLAASQAPLLIYRPDAEGLVGMLRVQAVPGAGEFYANPLSMALLPMTGDFQEGAANAWEAATGGARSTRELRADFCWRIDCAAWSDVADPLLEGGSHGAALATLLTLLLRGDVWSSDCALSAATDAQGNFAPVRGVESKALAAFRLRTAHGRPLISRLVVHPQNAEEARTAAARVGRDPERAVYEAASVREALPHASTLVRISRFLAEEVRWILTDAGRRQGRAFPTWEALRSSQVPVTVSHAAPARLAEADREGAGVEGAAFSTEMEWEQVRNGLPQAIVLGAPGSGKTMLLWQEVGLRCGEAYAALRAGSVTARTLEPAFFTRAADVAAALRGSSRRAVELEEALLEVLLARHDLGAGPALYLLERVREGRCLVAIDGLDEAPPSDRDRLCEGLSELVRECPSVRLLLGSRREGYARATLPFLQHSEFEIRPFSDRQVERVIRASFQEDPEAGEELWKAIRVNPRLRLTLRSPLLLRIACRVAAEALRDARPLPRWNRRVDLYETFLEEMVSAWSRRERGLSLGQRELFLDFAADTALELFRLRRHGVAAEVPQAVNRVQREYPLMAGRALVDDLCSAGILMNAGADEQELALTFTHATFGEYLAARSLAKQANQHGWHVIQGEVDAGVHLPEWQEVAIFLSGLLRDPTPLLKLLADPSRDDALRHRLALAALCIPEVVGGMEESVAHSASE